MRLTPVALVFSVILTFGLVAGTAVADAQAQLDHDTEEVIDAYNQNIDAVPDFIKNRFTDERVGLTVERDDGTDIEYTAVTDGDARITAVEDAIVDPTIRVTTDEETLHEVADADDPRAAAIDAFESDAVSVEGVGVTNTVMVESVKLGYRVASAIGLL